MSGTDRGSDKTAPPMGPGIAVRLGRFPVDSRARLSNGPVNDDRQNAGPSLQVESEVPTLAPGKSAERELSTGTIHRYRLQLQAGDYVRVAIDQQSSMWARAFSHLTGRLSSTSATGKRAGDSYPQSLRLLEIIISTFCVWKRRATGRYVARIDQQRPAA